MADDKIVSLSANRQFSQRLVSKAQYAYVVIALFEITPFDNHILPITAVEYISIYSATTKQVVIAGSAIDGLCTVVANDTVVQGIAVKMIDGDGLAND